MWIIQSVQSAQWKIQKTTKSWTWIISPTISVCLQTDSSTVYAQCLSCQRANYNWRHIQWKTSLKTIRAHSTGLPTLTPRVRILRSDLFIVVHYTLGTTHTIYTNKNVNIHISAKPNILVISKHQTYGAQQYFPQTRYPARHQPIPRSKTKNPPQARHLF